MSLDDGNNGANDAETRDAASVLDADDTRPLTADDGGSDVLRKATHEAVTDIAASDAEGLRQRVVIAVAQIFDHCRSHAKVIFFLGQAEGKLRGAAALALKENGIPAAITNMAVEMNRQGGGMTLDYRPYVTEICRLVVEHYKLLGEDGEPDVEKKAG